MVKHRGGTLSLALKHMFCMQKIIGPIFGFSKYSWEKSVLKLQKVAINIDSEVGNFWFLITNSKSGYSQHRN